MTKDKLRRINTLIPHEVFAKLKNLSEVNQRTMTEILKEAILLEEFIENTYRDGGSIIVKDKDGNIQELFKLLL